MNQWKPNKEANPQAKQATLAHYFCFGAKFSHLVTKNKKTYNFYKGFSGENPPNLPHLQEKMLSSPYLDYRSLQVANTRLVASTTYVSREVSQVTNWVSKALSVYQVGGCMWVVSSQYIANHDDLTWDMNTIQSVSCPHTRAHTQRVHCASWCAQVGCWSTMDSMVWFGGCQSIVASRD